MNKLDLVKTDKAYYTARTTPSLITLPQVSYLSLTGKGDPSGREFAMHIESLYPVAYALKFKHKSLGRDFAVPKLEGLWWYDEKKYPGKSIDTSATDVPRSEWEYRLLIRLPDFVTSADVADAVETVARKKKLSAAAQLEFFTMTEGLAVQVLHVGPYATEPATLKLLGDFMTANRLRRNGLHHEIYLSDFRKTEPARLKTILREPVSR